MSKKKKKIRKLEKQLEELKTEKSTKAMLPQALIDLIIGIALLIIQWFLVKH